MVSAEVLFLIAGGSGRVQLVCSAAQLWVDPPDRLSTLPLGPWLSQTSAGGQRSGLAFLCPNPPWVPTYPLSRGSPLPVTHTAKTCFFLFLSLFRFSYFSRLSHPCCLSTTFGCLTSSYFVLFFCFFQFLHCLLSLFFFCFGQQLSWHAYRGSNPPPSFPGPSVFPSFPVLPLLPPCPVPCHGIGRISLHCSSWSRLHSSQGFPLKKAFFLPLENCSLPTVTLST